MPNHDAPPTVGELPEFTVRRSGRARQARINVTPRHGVVVVVPDTLAGFDLAAAIAQRREWIEAALAHFAEQRAVWLAEPSELLPASVAFSATGEQWRVAFRETPSATVRAAIRGETLLVSGGVLVPEKSLAALQRWLQARAVERLVPRTNELAAQNGLSPAGVGVRGQHARWGGCSERGYLTLNRALLFLEPELVTAVILHELAHLAHPNHSAAFWDALVLLDPRCRAHHEAIARQWDRVPPWAERKLLNCAALR